MSTMSSIDLPSSPLGTKEHWDRVYSAEIANFDDIGDEGEVWFGGDSVEKMVDWAIEHVPPEEPFPYILEVGSGNGALLFALLEAGYQPEQICGVDYSEDAITLSKNIAKARAQDAQDTDDECSDSEEEDKAIASERINFRLCDFLKEDAPSLDGQNGGWDLVLDKGTFDAMALAEKDEAGRSPADAYPKRVDSTVKQGGLFLIVSCNFTEKELQMKFDNVETGLRYHSKISFPSFSFGGKSGNVYSGVAFHKPTAY